MASLQKAGIDADKALRDADIVAAIKRVLPDAERIALTPQSASDLAARATKANGDSGGNRWPPIISLSEEKGYFFRTGSAELLPAFREALTTTTMDKILSTIKQYDVDVIEIVGHTDEQAYGPRVASPAVDATMTPAVLVPPAIAPRPSNLDRGLTAILKNGGDIGKLEVDPGRQCGPRLGACGLGRYILRRSPKLAGYKMIPLSGGQSIDTDESLALNGTSGGDVAQRRRIEIRLRKIRPSRSGRLHPAVTDAYAASRVTPKQLSPRPVAVAPASHHLARQPHPTCSAIRRLLFRRTAVVMKPRAYLTNRLNHTACPSRFPADVEARENVIAKCRLCATNGSCGASRVKFLRFHTRGPKVEMAVTQCDVRC